MTHHKVHSYHIFTCIQESQSTIEPTLKIWPGPGQRKLENQIKRLKWLRGIYSQPLGQSMINLYILYFFKCIRM
jgi:hypothetical protein